MDEEKFVVQLQRADEEAWRQFVERFVPRMLSYALRHVKSRATAEDVAADAMARIVSSIKGFTYQGVPLDVWVYKIERNALSDYYRRQTGYSMLPFQEFMDAHSTGLLRDPYELAEAADTKAVVCEAIDHLEEPKRSVVRMRLLERRSVREVSFLLNLSESNVKVMLFRALTDVKTMIAGKMGEPDGVCRDGTETS
ncbi:MAG: sigma-70 family RNA polymerase sigma factor [Caldiserica bacterium]|nr:sigma-70 family RNA polymerase sigma factor [Caldisericota bacterium]